MMLKPNLLVLALICCCNINIVYAYGSVANPQTHLLNQRCSKYNASNLHSFFSSINGTFSRLKDQVNNHRKHFVTAELQARGKILIHTMFQCRNYLSRIDCLACFNTASTQIRNCSSAKGARVIYDGCFLRFIYCINTLHSFSFGSFMTVNCLYYIICFLYFTLQLHINLLMM